MSPTGAVPPEARAGIARWYTLVEDVVYVGLGLLLAGVVLWLLGAGFLSFGKSVLHGTMASSVIGLLDQILLILLMVELLATVQVSFREHALVPQPFLLVGMISVIRRVLVLTAEFGEKQSQGETVTQVVVLELAVLGGLILALAIALVLLRKRDASTTAPR
jgi:uncharacterized membrane protein (DUF373 family)